MYAFKVAMLALAVSMPVGGLGLELDGVQDPSSAAASSAAAGLWSQHYDAAKQFKADFKQNPRATAQKCRPGSNAMCASAAGSSQAAVLIATSPSRYNSLKQSSPINPISGSADAGSCASAQAAFATVAAAEAAVAIALQADARTLQISEADLFYCSPASQGLQETCRKGFDGSAEPFLQALVNRQQQLKLRQCMPYSPGLTAEQAEAMCANSHAAAGTTSSSSSSSGSDGSTDEQSGGVECSSSSSSSSLLAQGGLSFQPVTEMWQAQEHIRAYGGVISSFAVRPSSLKAFLADPANKHKAYSCSAAAATAAAAGNQQHASEDSLQSTAIFVVGYDNDKQFWIAQAAQGRAFGTNGFLRIAYGECGIMDATKTFGVSFKPSTASRSGTANSSSGSTDVLPTEAATPGLLYRKALQPAPPGKPAYCRLYSAGSFDYVSRVARVLGVPIGTLLADNADVIQDLDQPLIGKQLLVCARRGALH